MKYKFYVFDNKMICLSTFRGKTIRGIAKCDPEDTFNEDKGRKLSQLRCKRKVLTKRVKFAQNAYYAAQRAVEEAYKKLYAAEEKLDMEETELKDVLERLNSYENELAQE